MRPVKANGAVIDLHHSGCPADGVSDDAPFIQSLLDRALEDGHRVFRFPRFGEFTIGTGITIDGYDQVTFLADDAIIRHAPAGDVWMFKFLRVGTVSWEGGHIVGRRDITGGGPFNDDGERWIHHKSGSLRLRVEGVDVENFGGAAISAAAENSFFVDGPSPTPTNNHTSLSSISLRNSHSLINTKGGGYNQFSATDIHATNGPGIIKIDGEQNRPTEHPDYGPISSYVISDVTGREMVASLTVEAAILQVQENVFGGVNMTNVSLINSTNVGLLYTDTGQTDKPCEYVTLNNATVRGMNNPRANTNPAVTNRGGRNIKISDSQFVDASIYTTDSNSGVTRGLVQVDSSDFWNGQVRTFQSDAMISGGTRFFHAGSVENSPTAAIDATDRIWRNDVWIDTAWPQTTAGAGSHIDGPAVWTFTP